MELRFYIEKDAEKTEIEEPVGFDDFKTEIKRTDHHGISAEVSLSKLGFYNNAYGIVKEAYDTDIDTALLFIVEWRCADGGWTALYRGSIDLSTCEEETGEYCIIRCNVGEIGVKTTFNNRYETKVSMLRETTLDGAVSTCYQNLRAPVHFISKVIAYTSMASVKEESSCDIRLMKPIWGAIFTYEPPAVLKQPTGTVDIEEFGSVYSNEIPMEIAPPPYHDDECVFVNNSEEAGAFGDRYTLDIELHNHFTLNNFNVNEYNDFYEMEVKIQIITAASTLKSTLYEETIHIDGYQPYVANIISFHENITLLPGEKIFIAWIRGEHSSNHISDPAVLHCSVSPATSFKITYNSEAARSEQEVAFVHESFSCLSEMISGLTVQSEWYGRDNSDVNKLPGWTPGPGAEWPPDGWPLTEGGGALKGILNGYELRKTTLPSGDRPELQLSFKDLFDAMNAIDNIGWGFSEENGRLYVRVERWQWFYQNEVLLVITAPDNVTRKLDAGAMYTRLKTGYSKYMDSDEINAIDNFHTEREYTTGVKAVDKLLEKVCKFIADPYAIELTRRKQFDKKTTEDWKYDEDVFVVALQRSEQVPGVLYNDYRIIGSGNTVISPDTIYNVRISPARNARRWAERFFEANSSLQKLECTAGTGNVKAKGLPMNQTNFQAHYLEDSAGYTNCAEDGDIQRIAPLLKPEKLSFKYPVTVEDYLSIMANPYGQIIVDGEVCYINKITASLLEGVADFELIPAAMQ